MNDAANDHGASTQDGDLANTDDHDSDQSDHGTDDHDEASGHGSHLKVDTTMLIFMCLICG